MTTPNEELGPLAGPGDSAQRMVWMAKHAQAIDAQQMNSQTVHRLAAQGTSGADGVALMTRLETLVNVLFGTLDGHPGTIQMNDFAFRLNLELEMQQRIAGALANAEQMVAQARMAAGGQHQTQSGLFVAGKNDKLK